MDNKQFIEKLLSDPSNPQWLSETDEERNALVASVQKQEQRIVQSLEVPVPPELLTRLLEQQRRQERPLHWRPQIKISPLPEDGGILPLQRRSRLLLA